MNNETVMNIIGARFHKCLNQASKDHKGIADKLTDGELVHAVCVKERLTFYNYLLE